MKSDLGSRGSQFKHLSQLSQVFGYADFVHRVFWNQARFILRERIVLPQTLSDFQIKIEREITKVVAKRISFGVEDTIDSFFKKHEALSSSSLGGLPSESSEIRGSKNGFKKIQSDGFDSLGNHLCSSQNEPWFGPHFHAEALLLEKLLTSGVSDKIVHIQVSLKPCKMCAALIFAAHHAGWTPLLHKIVYLEDDPGPMAKNTILDEFCEVTKSNSQVTYLIPTLSS